MSNAVIVRRATLGDIPALVGLLGELFAIEADFKPDSRLQHQGLCLMLEDMASRRLLVAEIQDEVVGLCSLQVLVSTASGGLVGLVEDVVVKAAWRGRGIGARLMQEIDGLARELGLLRLQLLADTGNAKALDFYQRRGWVLTQLICLRRQDDRFRASS